MQFQSSSFTTWQEAEKRAAAAESRLFAKVLWDDAKRLPARAEVDEVRRLRDASNGLLRDMLAEMGQRAASLRTTRRPAGDHPGERLRGNGLVPHRKR